MIWDHYTDTDIIKSNQVFALKMNKTSQKTKQNAMKVLDENLDQVYQQYTLLRWTEQIDNAPIYTELLL